MSLKTSTPNLKKAHSKQQSVGQTQPTPLSSPRRTTFTPGNSANKEKPQISPRQTRQTVTAKPTGKAGSMSATSSNFTFKTTQVAAPILTEEKSLEFSLAISRDKSGINEKNSVRHQLLKELESLKKDLSIKNALVENLMNENSTLRNEMDRFLVSVDATHTDINTHFLECNQKIEELEEEVVNLRQENQNYKEQIQLVQQEQYESRNANGIESKGPNSEIKKTIEDVFTQLSHEAAEFMDYAKKQQEMFEKTIKDQIPGGHDITVMTPEQKKIYNAPQSSSSKNSNLSLISNKTLNTRLESENDVREK